MLKMDWITSLVTLTAIQKPASELLRDENELDMLRKRPQELEKRKVLCRSQLVEAGIRPNIIERLQAEDKADLSRKG